jgi:hypothetical protein
MFAALSSPPQDIVSRGTRVMSCVFKFTLPAANDLRSMPLSSMATAGISEFAMIVRFRVPMTLLRHHAT